MTTWFFCLLPLMFVLHDFEEIIVCKAWMRRHGREACRRYPWADSIIGKLSEITSTAFVLIVCEELIIISGVTTSLLCGFSLLNVWTALFGAFSIHLLIHIGQCLLWRGYTPGVITSIVCLPCSYQMVVRLSEFYSLWLLSACTVFGLAFAATNLFVMLRLAIWIKRDK